LTIVGQQTGWNGAIIVENGVEYPAGYKRVEWFDPAEGPLPNSDVTYPSFPHAAAFHLHSGSLLRAHQGCGGFGEAAWERWLNERPFRLAKAERA